MDTDADAKMISLFLAQVWCWVAVGEPCGLARHVASQSGPRRAAPIKKQIKASEDNHPTPGERGVM